MKIAFKRNKNQRPYIPLCDFKNAPKLLIAGASLQTPLGSLQRSQTHIQLNLAGISMRSVPIFGKFHNPPLGKDGLSLELSTRLHGFNFKYEFSKLFWRWDH